MCHDGMLLSMWDSDQWLAVPPAPKWQLTATVDDIMERLLRSSDPLFFRGAATPHGWSALKEWVWRGCGWGTSKGLSF